MNDSLDYGSLLQDALRGLVRRALTVVAGQGMPGEHHFYLAFRTATPGVVLPTHLKEQYPEEMTIVLKTQFQDLDVESDGFSVGLFFSGVLYRLSVPFAALVSFSDPSVGFQVVFQVEAEQSDDDVEPDGEPEPPITSGGLDNVVSFPGSRKKG